MVYLTIQKTQTRGQIIFHNFPVFKETEIAIKFYLYAKRILIRLPKQIFVDGILNGRKEYEWKERKGEF